MPNILSAKQPGEQARAIRASEEQAAIENDWTLIRFEPTSGNAVLEKNGKRVIVARAEFDALNFPGSDDLWSILSAAGSDEHLSPIRIAWAEADLSATMSALVRYARTTDPAFAGAQTASDIIEKTKEREDSCRSSLEISRLDAARAKREYDQYPARTPLEYDRKDNLLTRWRNVEDQYASHKYQCEKLVPTWQKLAAAAQALAKEIGLKR